MTVQYLCCLNATQMATVRRVVAAHPFPKLAVHFGEVICRTASFIATVDAETQRTLGAWVDRVEDAIIAAGPAHRGFILVFGFQTLARMTSRAGDWVVGGG